MAGTNLQLLDPVPATLITTRQWLVFQPEMYTKGNVSSYNKPSLLHSSTNDRNSFALAVS
jgi:hypothetical protein